MDSKNLDPSIHSTPNGQPPADDLMHVGSNDSQDIIPDEVPRKDGPGGEGE